MREEWVESVVRRDEKALQPSTFRHTRLDASQLPEIAGYMYVEETQSATYHRGVNEEMTGTLLC